jgi:hypothetical protein
MERFSTAVLIALMGAAIGAMMASKLRQESSRSRTTATLPTQPHRGRRKAAFDRSTAVIGTSAGVLAAAVAVLGLFVGHGTPSAVRAEPSLAVTVKASPTASAKVLPAVSPVIPRSGVTATAPSSGRNSRSARSLGPVR